MDDVIIVIPGITGSVLARNGVTVWAPKAGAALRAFFSGANTIRSLKLEGDDAALDDLGDGVAATGLVQDLHVFPGLWKIDGYTALRRSLFEQLALEAGQNYFEFPYDWRRDNRASARRLRNNAEGWLAKRHRTHPNAKLVLVAHSMGGIISRIFLDQMEGWRLTRRLLTFGTPYSGSLNALDNLSNGFRVGNRLFEVNLTETLRSFTSVWQLLPSYRCFRIAANDGWVNLDEPGLAIPGLDIERLADALELHRSIRSAVDANRATNYGGDGGYDRRPLVGDWQITKCSARLSGGGVILSEELDPGQSAGDGTVPAVSAVPHELLGSLSNVVYLNEKHASLQNNPFSSQNFASLTLQQGQVPLFPAANARLSVETTDVFVGEAATIRARASVANPALSCRVQQVGGGAEKTLAMTPDPADDRACSLTLPAPAAGDYRVTVVGTGFNAVTDLFSVVDSHA